MLSDSASLTIPPVSYETQRWIPQNAEYYSRSELRRQRGSYDSEVPAQIADWLPSLPASLSADAEDAARALLEFDTYALRILGADDTAVGPMAAILLRTESASSSQIENLTTSARQLALAELNESDKSNAMTVVGNVRAMEAALALSDDVNETTILAMHHELLRHQQGYESHAGKFRDQLVWIGKDNAGPLGADFVAPQAARVPGAVGDLVEFVKRDDLPIVVQVAVAHAQFETIHPFVDGNGRTGRALAATMLRNKRLVSRTTVPISAGLLTDTRSYFSALSGYRDGDADPIVHRFADASRFAAATGRQLVEDLARELELTREKLAGLRAHAIAWKVLPRLVGQPVVNAMYVKTELGVNDATAQRTLDLLVERGVLRERTGLRRNRVWEQPGILRVLDEYAEKVKRP